MHEICNHCVDEGLRAEHYQRLNHTGLDTKEEASLLLFLFVCLLVLIKPILHEGRWRDGGLLGRKGGYIHWDESQGDGGGVTKTGKYNDSLMKPAALLANSNKMKTVARHPKKHLS